MIRTKLDSGRSHTPARKRPLHPTRGHLTPGASQTQPPVTLATEPASRAAHRHERFPLVKTAVRVSLATVLAAVLACAALPTRADESGIRAALERPGVLLSGLQRCGQSSMTVSEGSQCLTGWSVNHLLLDTATRLATERGQSVFGEHFRVVSSLTYSPEGSGLAGGLDVVLPLQVASPALSGAAATEPSALFLQQGVTRWVDEHGSHRNDFRFGAVRRFSLSESGDTGASPGVVGVSAFVQQSREFQHTRLVGGADYAGNWGRASLNLFLPTTGWRPGRRGYEERALAGIELGVGLELTTTLSMSAAIGQWEDDDGLGGWSTNGRMSVGWRPHPWLSLGVAWNGLGTQSDARYRLAFSMPLGGTREPPRWTGLGLVGGGSSPSAVDPWRPVENVDAIQVARRQLSVESLVAGATVRFLQESAATGDRIGLEVRLPAATSRDLDLVVILGPGAGDNPAVAGVDYVDEPIAVRIGAGTSSAVVDVQLPLNAGLDETRSLSAAVTAAS